MVSFASVRDAVPIDHHLFSFSRGDSAAVVCGICASYNIHLFIYIMNINCKNGLNYAGDLLKCFVRRLA